MRGILVLFAALLAAGCVASPKPTPAPGSSAEAHPVDATELLSQAAGVARSWSPNAFLGVIMGSEGAYAQPDDPPYSYDTRNDPIVGDGLDLAWTYLYYDPAQNPGAYAVTVGADGTLLYSHTLTGRYAPAPVGIMPIPSAFVPSEQAAAVVNADPASKAFMSEHPTTTVHMTLANGRGAPTWYFLRSTSSGFFIEATVNGTSGQLLQISNDSRTPAAVVPPARPVTSCASPCHSSPPPLPPSEDSRKSSTMNPFNPSVDFSVAASHWDFAYNLTLAVDVPGTSPVDDVEIRVTDASGFVVYDTKATGHVEATFPSNDSIPGPYRMTVTAMTPPPQGETIQFVGHVAYSSYAPFMPTMISSGTGSVGFQQTSDQSLHLGPNASVTFRITFSSYGPGSPGQPQANATTWMVLDPSGATVAQGSSPQGSATFATTAGGSFTLRVTGGTDAVFGESYHFSATWPAPPPPPPQAPPPAPPPSHP